jgi:hypothetical protein
MPGTLVLPARPNSWRRSKDTRARKISDLGELYFLYDEGVRVLRP